MAMRRNRKLGKNVGVLNNAPSRAHDGCFCSLLSVLKSTERFYPDPVEKVGSAAEPGNARWRSDHRALSVFHARSDGGLYQRVRADVGGRSAVDEEVGKR